MINETLRKNINVDKPNLIPIFNLKEDDDAILKLALLKNSVEFDVSSQTLRLGAKTSKGLIEQLDGFTVDKNNIDIQLKNSILIPGVIEIDLEIKDAKGAMTTASFFITVNQKVLNDEAVEATNEFSTFTRIEENYNNFKNEVNTSLDNLESEVNELKEGNINIDLTNYATKTELSLKVDKVTGKSLISDSEIERLSTLKNYDDTDIRSQLNDIENEIDELRDGNIEIDLTNYVTKSELSTKADKTELHSHSNKNVLDGITSAKITEWNNKSTFDGNYNSLTNKPTIPTETSQLNNDSGFITSIPNEYVTETELNNYATKEYVEESINNAKLEGGDTQVDLSSYAKKTDLHEHSNKSILDTITSSKVDQWDNKSNFSGNYNDLTNKPTIPKPSNYKTAYGTCSTPASKSEKVVVIDDANWELEVGNIVGIRYDNTNSASNVTINVNDTGAYNIWYSNAEYTGSSTTYVGFANRTTFYMFTGTHWLWISNGVYPNISNASLGQGYGTCTTAESTLEKVSNITTYNLIAGGIVSINFTNAVPANSTLNIRSRGAKKIYHRNVAITDGIIKAGDTATFIYDGSRFNLISLI